ncbi:MAG: tRNA (adenine-N1)-methyltransferase [Anaerolineae bacterium]
MNVATVDQLVLLVSHQGNRYIVRLADGGEFHSHLGRVMHSDIIGQELGREVVSNRGDRFIVLQANLHDLIMTVERGGTIMYPKDIGYALLKLGIGPGSHVIEAGTGSGGLTTALAYYVRTTGRVYSYEVRADMQDRARKNIERVGLSPWVDFEQRDIAEGFAERDVDAVFLDVREPEDYQAQAWEALKWGGAFGALVPTTNQVSEVLAGMQAVGFADVEVAEILLRFYKTVPARLRPMDRMTAHTGYLLFGRKTRGFAPAEAVSADGADEGGGEMAEVEEA